MAKLSEIINFLYQKFPLENAEEWDPVGPRFLFSKIQKVNKIIICIDLTKDILEQAIKENVNLIITHHPFIFSSTLKKEYIIAPYKRQMVKKINKYKINIITLHTNFDGTNNSTANAIINALNIPSKIDLETIDKYNVILKHSTTFNEFVNLIKLNLNLKNLQTNVEKNYKIKNIAILPGSGGIEAALLSYRKKADLIVSSDFKWSDLLNLKHYLKMKMLIVPHLIEQFFGFIIEKELKNNFNIEIQVILLNEILKNI